MKIISQPGYWQFTCRVCKTELEIEPTDVLYGVFADRERVWYVDCPVCGEKRPVPRELLSDKIREDAERRSRKTKS
jgi:hypothetical protein